ncbi:FkbM family methyltransferase [Flavobacterium sp.]|uniref:FkbM family methyltransferase n=1 Tax=Flavobacterium sp. TaxID=239 RepID=UPI0035276E5E
MVQIMVLLPTNLIGGLIKQIFTHLNPIQRFILYFKKAGCSKNIFTYNMGMSENNNRLLFYKNNNARTSSFLEPNDFHKNHLARKYEKIEVPTTSIASFCTEHNINKIDILKLDIEGFELNALKGCVEMLKNCQIDFIYTEVNLIPTYSGQCLIEDVISFLRNLNYIPYNFYGNNESKFRESIITNIMFISPKVAVELNKLFGSNTVYTN